MPVWRVFPWPFARLPDPLRLPLPQGDATSYQRIVGELASGTEPSLVRVFTALIPSVAVLARAPNDFRELTNAVFGAGSAVWTVLADSAGTVSTLSEVFADFVSHLVSANCCYLLPALQAIIRAFRTTECTYLMVPNAASSVSSSGDSPGAPDSAEYLYLALKSVLLLVPTGISSLFRVLTEHFPPKRASAAEHRKYVRHLLRVSLELPPLRDRILAIIVDKMIQIDVRGAVLAFL